MIWTSAQASPAPLSALRPIRQFSFDRSPGRPSRQQAKKAERFYASRLLQIARHIGELVDGVDPTDPIAINDIAARLKRYGDIVKPWATSVASRMLSDVEHVDRQNWRSLSAEMGRLLHKEVEASPTGVALRKLLGEQIGLITSLPVEAAERIQRLATEGLYSGARSTEIAAEIMRSGAVAKSRATMIARTEVGRAHTTLTKVRAEQVGSTMFIWRTSRDSDVRPTHRALNGRTFRWDDPPECDPGHHALPGCIWNCRCFAEPIIDV